MRRKYNLRDKSLTWLMEADKKCAKWIWPEGVDKPKGWDKMRQYGRGIPTNTVEIIPILWGRRTHIGALREEIQKELGRRIGEVANYLNITEWRE